MSLHSGFASSFADPADVVAFRRCKAGGGTDKGCFGVGDNGVGEWGDDTTEGSGPSVALTPQDMITEWGSVGAARMRAVAVTVNNKTAIGFVKDTLPHHPKHGVVVDCNPDMVRALGLEPPILVPATWQRYDGDGSQ